MAQRTSGAQRIEMWNVAEREILKYKDNHFLWHKHIHNVELDAIQLLKCADMDEHDNTLDFSSRRMGKTYVKELYLMKYLACNRDQELGIVAPREAQSIVNMGYHLDAIRRSGALSAYINIKQGRRQMADTKYQFSNLSMAVAYGIYGQIDGGDLTILSMEEVDDMPHKRLFGNLMPMLGSTRRQGAAADSINKPQIRITGVYKGADTLTEMIDSGEYQVIGAYHGDRAKDEIRSFVKQGYLDPGAVDIDNYNYPVPIGNGLTGVALGLIQPGIVETNFVQMGEGEFARQYLCVNTSARNLIWEKWLQRAVLLGVKAGLDPASPIPGVTYKKRGLVSMGYDHTGHGESIAASRSSVVFTENLDGWLVPIFAKTWEPGTDESVIKRDLISFWKYFRPDHAMGDAFGVGLIGDVNDALYNDGLIDIDKRTLGSSKSHWPDWKFAPIQFEGMTKHSMAVGLATMFSSGRVALPYVDYIQEGEPGYDDVKDLQLLYKQLVNIKSVETSKSYASYQMVKSKIGDDLFDAMMAANWAMMNAGHFVVTNILIGNGASQMALERP